MLISHFHLQDISYKVLFFILLGLQRMPCGGAAEGGGQGKPD